MVQYGMMQQRTPHQGTGNVLLSLCTCAGMLH